MYRNQTEFESELSNIKIANRGDWNGLTINELRADRKSAAFDKYVAGLVIFSMLLGAFIGNITLIAGVILFWLVGLPVYFLTKKRKLKKARQEQMEEFRQKKQ